MSKKRVIDKEESEFKARHGRIPVAPPVQYFKDKSKYDRKQEMRVEFEKVDSE